MELNFLEIFGTIVGLVYLWLEYRASIYLWIAGIVMPAIYIFVYYKAGLSDSCHLWLVLLDVGTQKEKKSAVSRCFNR